MLTLRPYQERDLAEIRALIKQGRRRPLVVSPTGSGKGVLIGRIVDGARKIGNKVFFVVNRRSLVFDMSERVQQEWGIDHGVIMAGHPRNKPWMPVQVVSFNTLLNRKHKPQADVILVDEAHFSVTEKWLDLFREYPDALVIGFTATPIRFDGKGLGRYFDSMVKGPTVAELTADGYLVPAHVYRAPGGGPDMSGVSVTKNGEYDKRQRSAAVSKSVLIGDIVEHWLAHGKGEPTVCFATDVSHSHKIRDAFLAAGVRCEHVDAKTPDKTRTRLWRRLQAYEVEVVTSVGIISYGWNAPRVSVMIDAAPTMALAKHLQKCGRVLRSAPGKTRALILDHANNTRVHGFVETEREWTLKDGFKPSKRGSDDSVAGTYTCKKCLRIYEIYKAACPDCNEPRQKMSREIETVAGNLTEVIQPKYYRCQHCEKRGKLDAGQDYSDPCPQCGVTALKPLSDPEPVLTPAELSDRRAWYFRAVDDAARSGFELKRANVQYLSKYGCHAPKKWRDEAAQRMSESYEGLTA